jgi:hypothetical protein
MQRKGRICSIDLEHSNPHLQPPFLTPNLSGKAKVAPIPPRLNKNPQRLPIEALIIPESEPIAEAERCEVPGDNKRISEQYSEIQYRAEGVEEYIRFCEYQS